MKSWREIRQSLGLTQVDLAALLGVHQITVSKWECGRAEPGAWCAGLLMQFSTIPNPQEGGAEAKARLFSDGVPRALYELLSRSDAARQLDRIVGIAG